jgi:dTDP-4-dehydrorhamnose reductase
LGKRLASELPNAALSTADVTDRAAVRAAIAEHAPRAVVNAAGKTGRPNVDWCESHPTETYRANVLGALVHVQGGCLGMTRDAAQAILDGVQTGLGTVKIS